jgi:hypothetical protein
LTGPTRAPGWALRLKTAPAPAPYLERVPPRDSSTQPAPSRAVLTRAGSRPPGRRRRLSGDSGSGTLEYVGVATLVGAVLAALLVLPLAPNLSEAVRQVICKITQGDCGYARPDVRCTLATRDRTVGASATAFFVKVGHDDKYVVTTFGDGTAEVALADSYQAGVSGTAGEKVDLAALSEQLKAKGYAEGSLLAVGGYQTVYKFDSAADAEAWVDRNRDVLSHVTNAALGPAGDLMDQGLNWLSRTTGIGDQDDARAPNATVIDLGVQGAGGAGYGASTLAGVDAEAKATVKGSLRLNDDGTQAFTGSFEAEGSGTGSLAFISGKLGLAGKGAYTVSFDEAGNPTALTVVGEYGGTGGLGSLKSGLPVGGGGKINYGGNGDTGSKVNHSYTLNLENPANRAAFDQAFVTAGPVVLPRPTTGYLPAPGGGLLPDPAELAGQLGPLVDRMGQDAVYVRSEYDTSSSGGTVGAAAAGFGLDGTYKGSDAKLTKVESQDYGVPSSKLGPMQGCSN